MDPFCIWILKDGRQEMVVTFSERAADRAGQYLNEIGAAWWVTIGFPLKMPRHAAKRSHA